MDLSEAVIERLDLVSAISKAAPARGEFFPSRLEPEAALADPESYAEWLKARLASSFDTQEPEIVWVPRSSPGFRPVPFMAFGERAILSALVDLFTDGLVDDIDRLNIRSLVDTESEERSDFERQPLEEGEAAFIVIADVASCYEYIDHQQLTRDIVELTADIDAAQGVVEFLAVMMGREFGVPQGPRPSDLLSDIYLSEVDQRLLRSGAEVWRQNDDYLLGAANRQEALLLIRDLEAALRKRGLVLNHQKSRIVEREVYRDWVDALSETIEEANNDAAAGASFYTFDPDAFAAADLEDVDLEVVEALFSEAIDDPEQGPYREGDRLVQKTLPLLAAGGSLLPLRHISALTTRGGIHSRHLSLYLREMVREHPDEVSSAVGRALSLRGPRMVPWVKGWLLDPLARSDVSLKPKKLATQCRAWLRSETEPWFVRGRCAIMLAQREIIFDQKEFDEIFKRAPAAAKADFVAAAKIADPAWASEWLGSVSSKEPLLKQIAQWDDPDWFTVL